MTLSHASDPFSPPFCLQEGGLSQVSTFLAALEGNLKQAAAREKATGKAGSDLAGAAEQAAQLRLRADAFRPGLGPGAAGKASARVKPGETTSPRITDTAAFTTYVTDLATFIAKAVPTGIMAATSKVAPGMTKLPLRRQEQCATARQVPGLSQQASYAEGPLRPGQTPLALFPALAGAIARSLSCLKKGGCPLRLRTSWACLMR